ncbi:MAG TPA: 23S rRNA (uracil(1939)-C(5))-methyltransferase RlmD [Elusimicrobia bacterium]|nr:23S rRNA (uracil(1939)-C(5))-methyltransferase RlmD [Elusimicrobiota bacterium]
MGPAEPLMATATLKIERMTPGGQGLGRADGGRVCFVPYTAPGDIVSAEILRVHSGYAEARLLEVREPGASRVVPRCPLHFRPEGTGGPAVPCGGCDWQHLSSQAQLESKREVIRDCLYRIAKLRSPRVRDTLPSPEPWRYRNKVQVPFGTGPGGKIVAGFFAPHSHRIVDFDDCWVQTELSVRIALKVKELAGRLGWAVYDEDRDRGWLRHLFIRTNREGRALVALVTRTPDFPKLEPFLDALCGDFQDIAGVFQNLQPLKTNVVLGPEWRRLRGAERIEERVGPLRLQISPAAFLQVNTPACEVLYGAAQELLTRGDFRPTLALDLYSGVGSVALWISGSAERVLGVEENRDAVTDAWENARSNGVRNIRFLAGTVESQLRRIREILAGLPPGSAAAVLDPPRSGCSKPALKALLDEAIGRVVYISCNPATFARDADWLCRHHWTLSEVQPVDLFPQTSHVELVGLFERTACPQRS